MHWFYHHRWKVQEEFFLDFLHKTKLQCFHSHYTASTDFFLFLESEFRVKGCQFESAVEVLGKKWNHHWNHTGVGGGYFKEDNFPDTCHYLFNARTSQ
jgi:hypothetical protein